MLDNVNWSALSFALSALSFLVSAGVGVYVQAQKKHAATDTQVTELGHRVTIIETDLKNIPSGEQWSRTAVAIADIRGDVKTSAAEIHGLGAGLKRVENQVTMLVENAMQKERK